jgi:pimeloyl-ACP methyl ester carboxylesterase
LHREWIWRGHRIRYTFTPAQSGFQALSQATSSALSSAADQPEPFLLIHGFGASVRHWRSNLGPLSQNRSVYAIDMLGFGASDKDGTVYGTALWVEQLFDFVTEVVGRSVVVVGNSLGSVVGLGLAAKHPEVVVAIAWLNLPDFSAVAMPAFLKALTQPIGAVAKRVITMSPIFVPFFRWIRQPQVIRAWVKGAYVDETWLDPELVEILSSPAYDRHAARALAAMVLSQRELPSEYTARSALPRMSLPMLLIWGAKDQFVPPKIAQTILSFNPAVEFVSLPGVGHCPHDEVPDEINPILLSWLDRVLV